MRGFKSSDKRVSRIFRDKAMCEIFSWSLYTLYTQPLKRVKEFEIVLDEEEKKRKEKENNNMNNR